ncbi:glucose transporter type 1 isoform X2 [Phymastichus coffea]|uniref:glucose transporter type 1 isoform X2 n=1 Tax=Phymastichus coffea TaxID=108790 RepID=UPI00273BDA88|nr:glucose transporter type 1 isoform X2 [Phymastichus coffea]
MPEPGEQQRGGFKPVKSRQFWGISGAASTDADSECLYEEISGPSAEDSASSACADSAQAAAAAQAQQRSIRRTRKLEQHAPRPKADQQQQQQQQQQPRHRAHSQQHALRPGNSLRQQAHAAAAGQSALGAGGIGGLESRQSQASSFKLTRGRFSAARYLQTTTTTTTTTHYQQPTSTPGFAASNLPAPPLYHSASRLHRHGVRPATRHHFGLRGSFGNETQEEVPEEDEATLRELLISLQKQVSVMSMNLSAKLDDLQRGDRHIETTVALSEIRTQLQELTKSVESCQSEVSEVKRDMVAIKHELDQVQQIKEEIEELHEYVDRLEERSHHRKLRLLEQGLTIFLSYAILAAVLGMLQFGYNTGVINAPEKNIENFMKDVYKSRYGEDISEDYVQSLYSIAVSIFAIGGMVGGFSGGMIANRFGRKGGLLLNNVVGILGACLMGCTKIAYSYEMLFVGRFVIGVNCGLNTSLVPMYISEIAPLNLRGGLGTINQLAVTIGLLVSQILGIEQILGTNDGWPVLLGLAICPAILQLILLPFCPESPRYLLITKKWEEEARKALRKLRANNQVEEDIEEMRAEELAQQAESTISMSELLCSPTLRAPLIIGIVMQLSQQLSGINAVFYYSTSLFTTSGLPPESAKFATIGIGIIMVGMTLVSIPLMDRTGRRTLHLYGLGGMFIFSIFITISFLIKEMIDWMSYLSVVSILSFVVFFAVGPGSIPWMITAELFSQGPRPAAMSIAVLVNWLANFLVGICFPSMKNTLDNYTFLPFSGFLAVFWIFTYKKVPETKNKTFEEILALFRHGNGRSSLRDSRLYGSMLNCVNALEGHVPPAESAALMVAEEKPRPDTCKAPAFNHPKSVLFDIISSRPLSFERDHLYIRTLCIFSHHFHVHCIFSYQCDHSCFVYSIFATYIFSFVIMIIMSF